MKYWSIAVRTGETKSKKSSNNMVPVVFYSGILLILATYALQAVLIYIDPHQAYPYGVLADTLVLLVQILALAFLVDSFRRFLKVK